MFMLYYYITTTAYYMLLLCMYFCGFTIFRSFSKYFQATSSCLHAVFFGLFPCVFPLCLTWTPKEGFHQSFLQLWIEGPYCTMVYLLLFFLLHTTFSFANACVIFMDIQSTFLERLMLKQSIEHSSCLPIYRNTSLLCFSTRIGPQRTAAELSFLYLMVYEFVAQVVCTKCVYTELRAT